MLKTLRRGARRLVRWLRSGGKSPGKLSGLPPLANAELQDIWDKVAPFTMTGRRRVAALLRSIAYVEQAGIPGDIVECGVWKGGSMMAAALALLGRGGSQRRLFLFDTFEGMPPPAAIDKDLTNQTAAALLAQSDKSSSAVWAYCPLKAVMDAMASTGYPRQQIVYVQGKVENTVPVAAPEQIAVLRLDTDWYESTHHELEHLFPRLAEGGVLILDDYGHWQGARRAVDEYFAKHHLPALQEIDYTGRLLIKPRSESARPGEPMQEYCQ